jgi:hypothetical protein
MSGAVGYARRAVLDTVRTLGEEDLTGLLWFDSQARVALRLARYDDPVQEIERAWSEHPGRGTVLASAIRSASRELSNSGAEQRLMVVVTDGFLSSSEDFGSLEQQITDGRVEVIPLVIGENVEVGPLRWLSSVRHGEVLRVQHLVAGRGLGLIDHRHQPLARRRDRGRLGVGRHHPVDIDPRVGQPARDPP